MTGPGSNTTATAVQGVKAGIGVAGKEGYHFKYVLADTGTSLSGALAAAQKLVDQDHAFAVVATSTVTFAAAPWLAAHHIPVVGANWDGLEWNADKNMFSVFGTTDYTKPSTTQGLVLKRLGVTNLGDLGYGIVPSSSDGTKGIRISAEQAGLKVGYFNPEFPFGSTNVGPEVLAMKQAGVNGYMGNVLTNTNFALIEGLRQEGVHLKAPLLAVGYGGDLVGGGPGAEQAAQGVYFMSTYEPVEMHTAATEALQNALKTYAGVTSDPTDAEYIAYASIDALVKGLQLAGKHPTQSSFITALDGVGNYNAAGLYGSHSISFRPADRGKVAGADNCDWITVFQGSTFHLVPGMDPICGQTITGKRA